MKMTERARRSIISQQESVEQTPVDIDHLAQTIRAEVQTADDNTIRALVDRLLNDRIGLKILLSELIAALRATNKELSKALSENSMLLEKMKPEAIKALKEYLANPTKFTVSIVANDVDLPDQDFNSDNNPMLEYYLTDPDGKQHHLFAHWNSLAIENPTYLEIIEIAQKIKFLGKDSKTDMKQLSSMLTDSTALQRIFDIAEQENIEKEKSS